MTLQQIDALEETGKEQWAKLRRSIPIYILHFTNCVDECGVVRVHHDVYNLDEALESQTVIAQNTLTRATIVRKVFVKNK